MAYQKGRFHAKDIQRVKIFSPLGLIRLLTHLKKGFDFSGVRRKRRAWGMRGRGGREHGKAILSCIKSMLYES